MRNKKLDFITLSNNFGGYYNFWRAKVGGYRGTLYAMSRDLTDAEKSALLTYGNVKLYVNKKQFAPEISSPAVFIADKCFKVATA